MKLGEDLLYIDGGKVRLKGFVHFNDLYNETLCANLLAEIDGLRTRISCTSSVNQQEQFRSRIAAYKRLQGGFWPTGRRMTAKGIQVADEQGHRIVHTNAADIQGALSNYWGEVYATKAFESDKAAKFVDLYVRQQSHIFDSEELTLPDEEDFSETIMRVKDSAARPDGVTYSA